MVRKSLPERVRAADYIVQGTVIGQTSRLTRVRGLRMIYTDVRVRVSRSVKALKGEAVPAELTIRVPGGQVGRLLMTVSDMPRFAPGEHVVVLLRRRGSLCQLVQGSRGTYILNHASVSGAEGQPLPAEDMASLGVPSDTAAAVAASTFLQKLEALAHE